MFAQNVQVRVLGKVLVLFCRLLIVALSFQTVSVSMLLRYSHQQIFHFIGESLDLRSSSSHGMIPARSSSSPAVPVRAVRTRTAPSNAALAATANKR